MVEKVTYPHYEMEYLCEIVKLIENDDVSSQEMERYINSVDDLIPTYTRDTAFEEEFRIWGCLLQSIPVTMASSPKFNLLEVWMYLHFDF